MTFEKSLGKKINDAMESGEAPNVIFRMMGEATRFYGEKLNDAFVKIDAADVPYMIAALDTYKRALINAFDLDGKGELEEAAHCVETLMKPTLHMITTNASITEAAARELVRAMRNREE